MKNSLVKLIFVSAFAFVFTIQTNAQLCGKYKTAFSIVTTENKPVENAVVKLIPLGKDETMGKNFVRDEKKLSEFSITFIEGHKLRGKYKVMFAAEGYKPFETEIRFPHCERRNFILTLEKSDSKIANNLEEIREVVFIAIDENKKGIGKVKTTVSWENGKFLEKIASDSGQTNFEVFNNKILKVRFEKDGYQTKEIEVDLSAYVYKYMDVKLEKTER